MNGNRTYAVNPNIDERAIRYSGTEELLAVFHIQIKRNSPQHLYAKIKLNVIAIEAGDFQPVVLGAIDGLIVSHDAVPERVAYNAALAK